MIKITDVHVHDVLLHPNFGKVIVLDVCYSDVGNWKAGTVNARCRNGRVVNIPVSELTPYKVPNG